MVIEGNQINEWIERAFKNAVRHGWHEEEKPTIHWLMMIITEVSEAIQADRKGRWMDDLDKSGLKCVLANDHHGGLAERFYRQNIDGKVESEIADICIRLFDFMGVNCLKVKSDIKIQPSCYTDLTFTGVAFCVTERIIDIINNKNNKVTLLSCCLYALDSIFEWAEALNIDLVQHINLKMRYNETRKYHHGDKKY